MQGYHTQIYVCENTYLWVIQEHKNIKNEYFTITGW